MQIGEQLTRATIKIFPTNDSKLARFTSEENIFTDRHLPDEREFLEDNRNARLCSVANSAELLRVTFDENLTTILRVWIDAAEDFHQGRLTSAVFPDQRVHLTLLQIQTDAIKRAHTREGLGDVAHLEEWVDWGHSFFVRTS